MRVSWVVVVMAGAVLVGCSSSTVPPPASEPTFPQDFTYITREQLDFAMWQLAKEVHGLNQVMRAPGSIDEHRRAQILGHLTVMETTARNVKGQPGWHSSHPVLDEKLAVFAADVGRARRAAQGDPPNYYLAGSVAGACLYCHGNMPD